MDLATARRRVQHAPVGHLATVRPDGRPHVVVCCFALVGDVAYTAVDAKPKSTLALQRVTNLGAQPAASLMVDHYEDDWSQLWWVRLDGTARIIESATASEEAHTSLQAKYAQYAEVAIPGPVIALDIHSWRMWP